jgi:hypothetical protein
MDITKIVQLLQSSYYLKQDVVQLTVVAVLPEVRSKVHFVPLNCKDHSILGQLSICPESNMFAIPIESLVQNVILVVELLGEHKVQLEVVISPKP